MNDPVPMILLIVTSALNTAGVIYAGIQLSNVKASLSKEVIEFTTKKQHDIAQAARAMRGMQKLLVRIKQELYTAVGCVLIGKSSHAARFADRQRNVTDLIGELVAYHDEHVLDLPSWLSERCKRVTDTMFQVVHKSIGSQTSGWKFEIIDDKLVISDEERASLAEAFKTSRDSCDEIVKMYREYIEAK